MELSYLLKRGVWSLSASGALFVASITHAQVEALNPNPTLPAGTSSASELEGYHHGSTAGTRIGREIGGRVDGADKNPAEMMLRELNGTNRGRRTGRAAIRGGAVRAALRVETYRRALPSGDNGAVYFARRGDYENAIYAPQKGSYYERAPRRSRAAQTRNQR